MPEVSIPKPRFTIGQQVVVSSACEYASDYAGEVFYITGVTYNVRMARVQYAVHTASDLADNSGGVDDWLEEDLSPHAPVVQNLIEQPATRSWQFSDIKTGDVFWLSADRRNPHICMAQFGHLSADGLSRQFDCLNGAWKGTLTLMDEGAMEMFVPATKSRHFVYVTEKVEHAALVKTEHEVAF